MILTAKDYLIKARELLSEEQKWVQGVLARDENNISVCTSSDTACKFCLLGSLFRVSHENVNNITLDSWPEDAQVAAEDLLDLIVRERGLIDINSMVAFNDAPGRTHAEILALLDEAIERA